MQWEEFLFHLRHLSTEDQQRIAKAFELGAKAHADQKRQSGEPYFTHPIAVAQILIDMGADADTLIAALLHDTVEDTAVTLEDIDREFGPVVAALVDGVTKLNEQDVTSPSLDEQIETLRKMFTLMQKDIRIMVIKLADRLHNMQTISYRSAEKQRQVAKETLDVYVKIADRLCMRDVRDSLEEMSYAVLEPQIQDKLMLLRKNNEDLAMKEIDLMKEHITTSFPEFPAIDIHFEKKSWERLRMQYELQDAQAGFLGLNIAIICKDIDTCYRMLGVLHRLWRRETLTFDDFINAPIINGYKGLHTSIIMEDGTRLRCKIRTTEMDEYSHRGITLLCFDKQERGLLDYLPWVEHISPVAQDTMNRSDEFWQSLQTDILGESIVIFGTSNESVLVPKGSTALDGAFYLFGKKALYLQELQMNGLPVSFYDELTNASTLTAVFAAEPTVKLQWLQYAHTGIASAAIRSGLMEVPTANKKVLGRQLLEQSMRRHTQVSLDELSASAVKEQLSLLHMSSLSQLYVAIAEGRLDPEKVAINFFGTKKTTNGTSNWTLKIKAPFRPGQENDRVGKIIMGYPFMIMRYKRIQDMYTLTMRYMLTSQEASSLQLHIGTILSPDQWRLFRTWRYGGLMALIVLLVLLWGLDPVIAHHLLIGTIHPFDLTFVRFLTFFITSLFVYAIQTTFGKQKLKPLSPLQPSLILSGVALFITGLFTYLALAEISATKYILFIVAGLVVTDILSCFIHKRGCWIQIVSFVVLLTAIAFRMFEHPTSLISLLCAIAASLGFSLYSEVSRRYQEEDVTIHARYPAFMFWIASVCLLLSIFLLPVLHYSYPSLRDLFEIVSFSIVFAVLPYVLFFEVMRRSESKILGYSLPLVVLATIVGELFLMFSMSSLVIVPIILIFLWLYSKGKATQASS